MSSEAQNTQTLLLGKEQESPRNLRRSGMNNENNDDGGGGFPWLTGLGFAFLTFNSVMAIYRSDRDLGSILFVGISYLDLVLLFVCLRLFEKAPRESPRRGWLKACVWALTTLLTVMFSHKVASIMPPLVALVVWAMAFATIAGGFYAFFIYKDKAAQLEEANRQRQVAWSCCSSVCARVLCLCLCETSSSAFVLCEQVQMAACSDQCAGVLVYTMFRV